MGVQNRLTAKRLLLGASIAAIFGGGVVPAHADSYDVLLEKLRAKGVISDSEYDEFKTMREEDMKAAEKPAAAEGASVIGKFKDGFSFETADGQHAFSVNGRLQGDFRAFQNNTAPNTFDLRRAYLGVKGRFYKDISFNVTGDFAQSSAPQLDEAYVNFGWYKPVQLRVGQFQMPFSLEKITSDLWNDFQERNIGDTMAPDKVRGAMIHGSPSTGVYYGLAVANGNGAKNTNDTVNRADAKEGIGRVAVNVAEMLGQKDAIYHFGGSYARTSNAASSSAATAFSGTTEAKGLKFFVPLAFTGSNVDREETGLETALAYGPVKLQAEAITANYTGTASGGNSYDKDIKTYYVSLNWMITGESFASMYSGGSFGRLKPNANFTGFNGGGWGAWQVGVRFSKWDAGDFKTGAAGTGLMAAGSTAEADATTLGVNWIINPNTRMKMNYVYTKFDTPVAVNSTTVSDEKALTLRAQFDF